MLLRGRRVVRHDRFEPFAHSVAITGVLVALFVVAYRSGGATTALALIGATVGLAVVVGAVVMLSLSYVERDANLPGSDPAAVDQLIADYAPLVPPGDRELRRQEEPVP